jgi:DNA-binding CsgD family transcriptional regulator
LTNREKQILILISEGLDSVAISEFLFISASTVNNHRQHILNKIHTENISEALFYVKIIGVI